jgi:hypothetical protein
MSRKTRGKHEQGTKRKGKREMQQGWMNEWMDGWMRHIKTQNKKWMSFGARKSIQLLGFVFGEFF